MNPGPISAFGSAPGNHPSVAAHRGISEHGGNSAVWPWLVIFTLAVCIVQSSRAASSVSSEPEVDPISQQWLNQKTREAQEHFRKRVTIPGLAGPAMPDKAPAINNRTQVHAQLAPDSQREDFLLSALWILAVSWVALKLGPQIIEFFQAHSNPWVLVSSGVADLSSRVLAEEDSFAEFLTTFRAGPVASPSESKSADSSTSTAPVGATEEFFARAPEQLAGLRKLVHEIGRGSIEAPSQEVLRDLYAKVHAFKGMAGLSEVLPAWQMATALEGLLKQLTNRVSNVSPSTLRTVASGVDLLETLCRPGLRPDLATNPPVRLLAVDDEPISRNVVSHSLRKSLNKPDLAENGEAALALATQLHYDVVFLDVQMPGMDGFELCSKIHQTDRNRTTPVVFVTCQSDFQARAKSALLGGHALNGKPFLTFEITVKALTLVLRGRLPNDVQKAETAATRSLNPNLAPPSASGPAPVADGGPAAKAPIAQPYGASVLLPSPAVPACAPAPAGIVGFDETAKTPAAPSPRHPPEPVLEAPHALEPVTSGSARNKDTDLDRPQALPLLRNLPDKLVEVFFSRAPLLLGELRNLLKAINRAAEQETRQKRIGDMHLRIHSMAALADHPELRPASRVCSALEGLLKKLVDNPKNSTASTLHTVATALDLLDDLCVQGIKPDLAVNPPIHILAVDDDPVARRAMSGALQTAFEKPISVESGEAALAEAMERSFDVIFLDARMPGMDGFTVCSKIHETTVNTHTPVVFVTSRADLESQSESARCGGSELIAKPFLTIEITLKALTFALRGRLQRLQAIPKSEAAQESERKPVAQFAA
jgi:CheY-like chemotaxis protein